MNVKFGYSGFNISHMKVEQFVDGSIREWGYDFSNSVFLKEYY